jgi:thymidine kinase
MSLDLIMGPMFSGKSSELIRRVHRLRTIDHSYVVYNSSDDDRYGVEGVYTHDMKSIQCISVKTLQPEYTTLRFKTAQTIFIDEAQFFKDLFNFVRDAVEIHKKTRGCYRIKWRFTATPIWSDPRLDSLL